MQEPNDRKYTKSPYGDNLIARCDDCGKPIHLCICDDEDEWQDDVLNGDYETKCGTIGEAYEPDVDGYGRNYSDADPGL